MSPCTSISNRQLWVVVGVAALTMLGALPLQASPAPPLAQTPAAEACTAMDVGLPPTLASWAHKTELASATSVERLSSAMLTPGGAAQVMLHNTREIAYPLQPEKPGGSVAHGGLVAFRVDHAGTWRIGLSSGAWIDVVKDRQAEVSIAHGHGPPCSTLRKLVDFTLQPGLYTLQISASADVQIGVLVVQAP
jgi:hypothetical protein